MTVNPIDLEIVTEGLIPIVREMLHTIFGTAHFPVIADAQDFSCALFDARGLMVAQGRDMPGHVAAMPASVAEILVDFGRSMAPGDVYIVNDPYRGGSHLNDVTLISPVFFDDTLFLFPCVCMHWGDIGGMTPGTASGEATEILQGAGVPADQAGRARPTQPDRLRHSLDGQQASAVFRGPCLSRRPGGPVSVGRDTHEREESPRLLRPGRAGRSRLARAPDS